LPAPSVRHQATTNRVPLLHPGKEISRTPRWARRTPSIRDLKHGVLPNPDRLQSPPGGPRTSSGLAVVITRPKLSTVIREQRFIDKGHVVAPMSRTVMPLPGPATAPDSPTVRRPHPPAHAAPPVSPASQSRLGLRARALAISRRRRSPSRKASGQMVGLAGAAPPAPGCPRGPVHAVDGPPVRAEGRRRTPRQQRPRRAVRCWPA